MARRRIWIAFALATVVILDRGAVDCANANARWNPAFNDPSRVDVSEINDLIAKTVLYTDPMDEVRGLLLLPPAGFVPTAFVAAIDGFVPRANRPRAPPAL